MPRTVVLTILGDDRPGILHEIADVVASKGGNWIDASMSRLAGHFAGIVRVDAPDASADALIAAVRDLEGPQFRVHVTASAGEQAAGRRVVFDVVGHDTPGIVRDVSKCLAAHDANVESFSSDVRSAPMSGEPMFHAHFAATLPSDDATSALQEALEALAADLMVDLDLDR